MPPPKTTRESALAAVETEMVGEKAATLGRSAKRAETALARLAAYDAEPEADISRAEVLKSAAVAVWQFFIQREVCGLRDHRLIIAEYRIPKDVLARLGAF